MIFLVAGVIVFEGVDADEHRDLGTKATSLIAMVGIFIWNIL
jgi:hypothetical protein